MRHITTILATMFAVPMMAQLDNTVEVTNEVKPVVTDAQKVEVKTQAAETKVKHYTMTYAVQGQPLNEYTPEPLGDYSSEAVWKGNKRGYIHLSGGSHGNIDGEVAYRFDLTDRDALDVDLFAQGFNGKVKDNEHYGIKNWTSRDYRNRSTLKYNHRFDNGVDFFVKGGFENRVFNYMGGNNVTDKQHDVLGDVAVEMTPYKVENFTIGATANVDFFSQNYLTSLKDKLGETLIRLGADAAYSFTDEHSVGLGLGFLHSAYGNDELKGITRLRFTPHYIYNTEQMQLKLGVFVSTKGNVAPDVAFTYHINPRSDVYVEASGYEQDNDFRRFSSIHPYFVLESPFGSTLDMEAEFHQIDARVGYRFKTNGFTGDLHTGFDLSKNAPDTDWISNSLNGIYYPWIDFSKSRRFYLNADFTYAYKDIVKVTAKHQVNVESNKSGDKWVDGSYVAPDIAMLWNVDVKLVKDLYFGLDWEYAHYSMPDIDVVGGTQYERPNTVNLGANLRYTLPIKLPLTVFVKGDNLLDQKFDRYFGYRHIGANFLGGFALSF